MAQSVDLLRGFFSAFFAVEQPVWSGFLAGWPGLPNNHYHETWAARMAFALKLFTKMPIRVKLTMMLFAINHTLQFGPNTLLRSLLPDFLFGSIVEDSEEHLKSTQHSMGDMLAKNEARDMIKNFEIMKSQGRDTWKEDDIMTNKAELSTEVIFPSPFN